MIVGDEWGPYATPIIDRRVSASVPRRHDYVSAPAFWTVAHQIWDWSFAHDTGRCCTFASVKLGLVADLGWPPFPRSSCLQTPAMRLPKIGMLVALPDLGMDDSLATGKGVPLCFLELKLTVSSDLKEIHPSPQIEGSNAIGGLAPLLSPDRLAPFRQEKGEPQLATAYC